MEHKTQEDSLVELLGAMIALGRAVEGNKIKPDIRTHNVLLSAMYLMIPGTGLGEQQREAVLRQLRDAKNRLIPRCIDCKKQCGRNDEFSVYELGELAPSVTSVKEALLMELLSFEPLLRGESEKALQDEAIYCLYDALFYIGRDCSCHELIPVLQQLQQQKTKLMETLLSKIHSKE